MHKFILALLVVAAIAFVSASARSVQAPAADQGGGITPGVGLDSIAVPSGGRKSKSRKLLP